MSLNSAGVSLLRLPQFSPNDACFIPNADAMMTLSESVLAVGRDDVITRMVLPVRRRVLVGMGRGRM